MPLFQPAAAPFRWHNSNQILGGGSCQIFGDAGQLVIDGSSNGVGDNGDAVGENGNASFNLKNSSMTLSNGMTGEIFINESNGICGSSGQMLLDGSSNGVVTENGGSGNGSIGNATFVADNDVITLTNLGIIQGGIFSDIIGSAGQMVINGSSNAFASSAKLADGKSGNASFTLNNSQLTLNNENMIQGGFFGALIGSAGQLVIDGSCNQLLLTGSNGSGSAIYNVSGSTLNLTNSGLIQGSSFLFFSGGPAGQMVFDGSGNQFGSSGTIGSGSSVLNIENSTLSLSNSGQISSSDSTIGAQLVFEGSGTGSASLNAGRMSISSSQTKLQALLFPLTRLKSISAMRPSTARPSFLSRIRVQIQFPGSSSIKTRAEAALSSPSKMPPFS